MSAPQMGFVQPAPGLPAPAMPAAAPAPRPAPQPTGIKLERLGREKLLRMIGLHVAITAPTWNQTLFSSKRIPLKIDRPPARVLEAIDQIVPPPEPGAPPDAVDDEARALLRSLSDTKPRPLPPRSIAGGRPMDPPADLVAKWLRKVYLVVGGPEAIRLLAAAGYLTPDDVDTLEVVYPKGLDEERQASVAAAQQLAVAMERNKLDHHDLPTWLNDQLLILMDDRRPSDFYKPLYAQDAKQQQTKGPDPSGNGADKIAQQNAPAQPTNR